MGRKTVEIDTSFSDPLQEAVDDESSLCSTGRRHGYSGSSTHSRYRIHKTKRTFQAKPRQ
ncbi:hypothetical protein H5410_038491 [Solanum commersonii]|uniref:Uncharacterized protein n=1 Tax=Solanum commersonii TaxID=4109 RepID=A0A9J5Y946_SOLCO|nr:hypothetical protein H5410_038491 [Solanum commersonii]